MSNYADALKRKAPPPPPPPSPEPSQRSSATSGEGSRTNSRGANPTLARQQRPLPPPHVHAQHAGRGNSARPSASNKPVAVLKRPKEAAQQAAKKKPKKPKPTLQNMSLGDVLFARKAKPHTRAPPEARPPVAAQIQTTSVQEFPSLSAGASVPTMKPKPPPMPAHHGSWAKKPAAAPSVKKEKQKTASQVKTLNSSKQAAKHKNAKKKESDAPMWQSFGAKPRTEGEENDLVRMLKDGKFQTKTKGKTRLQPRKKKFTTLKKKVLQERLDEWRRLHPEDAPMAAASTEQSTTSQPEVADTSTCTVCLYNFAESDEVKDDDEYEEIVENLKDMANKVEPIRHAFLLRQSNGSCPAFVWFKTPQSAAAACACWKGLVLSGARLEPSLLYPKLEGGDDAVTNEVWRQAVASVYSTARDRAMQTSNVKASIVLRNVLTMEDFEDKDSLEESLADIRSLAEQHGSVFDIQATQEGDGGFVVVTYNDGASAAMKAVSQLNGLVVGGMIISATLADERAESDQHSVVQLKNALTADDFDDEECLQESLDDIKTLSEKFGRVSGVCASEEDGGLALITFKGGVSVARAAAENLDGTLLGGNVLSASMLSDADKKQPPGNGGSGFVLLQNVLTEDDLEDEDCLQESLVDVKELASQYGKVSIVSLAPEDAAGVVVQIEYEEGVEVANAAAEKFNGMVLGGQSVVATTRRPGGDAHEVKASAPAVAPQAAAEPTDSSPAPMYSGDKLIPERFAEMKRIPKLATATAPRDYAHLKGNDAIKTLLIEMLGELMRLQRRAIEDKNAKARRRVVMGLREVARGIRAHKVKMVAMANNVDQYGALDDKLQEILDLAREADIPVIFELNKRRLGKAVGKNIKVSVVGIQNADGAHQLFKKLSVLARL